MGRTSSRSAVTPLKSRRGGLGNLHKSTIPQAAEKAAYVPREGPDNTNDSFIDRHGVRGNDAPVAQVEEANVNTPSVIQDGGLRSNAEVKQSRNR
jgi:hypothetical protein